MRSISPEPVANEVDTAAPPRRILVVDDNLKIHEDFAKILGGRREASALDAAEEALFGAPEPRERSTSFHLDCAHRGEDAAALAARAVESGSPFALAFVDLRMAPGWDGVRTALELWRVDP
ncbi:hypothetical protein [Sorangium sp. So ce341]|uniref:hypothetical protein n=1 Tax=Sorangium sp. So ce341 TaxID=3133302 RepID=UPI003F637184